MPRKKTPAPDTGPEPVTAAEAAEAAMAMLNACPPVELHPAELAEPVLPAGRTKENWPMTLDDDTAIKLLESVESGETRTKAPAAVGLTYRTVARWCTKHPLFATWYNVASDAGYQQRIDRIPQYAAAAFDRDTAAAAKVKIEAEEKYLRYSHPTRFGSRVLTGILPQNTSEGDDADVGWVVLVPAKVKGSVIDGPDTRRELAEPTPADLAEASGAG